MRKWSSMSKSLLFKLIYRATLFISALVYFIVMMAKKEVVYGLHNVLFVSFGDGFPVFLVLMALVFVPEMVMRFFPNGHETLGSQKMFKANYIPPQKKKEPKRMSWKRTLLVFGAWAALNIIFGVLNILGVVTDDVMVLLCLAYSVCDLICIMFFCPFQKFMMKNKCCQTCRIYNWDYPMMFTPFLFLIYKPGPILHYIMLALALAVLLIWEITYHKHPERFSDASNESLTCKNCPEKLCRHNKFYPIRPMRKKSKAVSNEAVSPETAAYKKETEVEVK